MASAGRAQSAELAAPCPVMLVIRDRRFKKVFCECVDRDVMPRRFFFKNFQRGAPQLQHKHLISAKFAAQTNTVFARNRPQRSMRDAKIARQASTRHRAGKAAQSLNCFG